jgi:hypothetical protein
LVIDPSNQQCDHFFAKECWIFCDQFFGKRKKIDSQYYHKNVATFGGYFVTRFSGKPYIFSTFWVTISCDKIITEMSHGFVGLSKTSLVGVTTEMYK